MRCIHCDNSFTCISTNNENNKFGKKYKILTGELLPFLMNKKIVEILNHILKKIVFAVNVLMMFLKMILFNI